MKALVLIDIQNDYFNNGANRLDGQEAAAENAAKILAGFRSKGLPVFHVQHIALQPEAPFFKPGTFGVEIHKSVAPLEGEEVVTKHYPNSFQDTVLHEKLQVHNITELVVCGSMSHMCIDTSVRAAFTLGYKVTLAEDACAAKTLEFNGKTIPADVVHAAYMAGLSYPFANVVKTVELTE